MTKKRRGTECASFLRNLRKLAGIKKVVTVSYIRELKLKAIENHRIFLNFSHFCEEIENRNSN